MNAKTRWEQIQHDWNVEAVAHAALATLGMVLAVLAIILNHLGK